MQKDKENHLNVGHKEKGSSIKEDEELVRLTKENLDNFKGIYDKYWEQIYRFVFKRIQDEDLVKDVTQDVFLKAMQKIKSYENRGYALSSWLYRIALNEIANVYRWDEKERAIKTETKHLMDLKDEVYDVSEDLKIEKLMEAIDRLKPKEVQMIQMRYFEKRKLKEVAEIMDMSESTCKVKMFRIMTKLRGGKQKGNKTLLLLMLFALSIMASSCSRQKSLATGWESNDYNQGGFGYADANASMYGEQEIVLQQLAGVKVSGRSDKNKEVIAQKLIYQASLTIESKTIDSLPDLMQDFAKKHNGYISRSNYYSATIRIPKESFEVAMAELDDTYNLINKNVNANDVSFQYSDLKVRLENTVKAREQYLKLLEKAVNVQEALLVEKELERLNMQFDLLQGQLNGLDNQIQYTTINVSYREKVKLGLFGVIGKGLWVGVKWLFVRN